MLVTDGADAQLLAALQQAAEAEGAMIEIVAPTVGGVTASDGNPIPAKQKINGGSLGALRRDRRYRLDRRSGVAGA